MDPIGAGAMLQMGSDTLNDRINVGSSLITSAFNIHEARQNRRFMRNMSNTEMQRRLEDLKKAGINPLMAVGGKGLGGASVPHSAAGQAETPRLSGGRGIEAMQLMLQARLNDAQVEDLTSAAQLKKAQAGDISFMQKDRLINLQAQTLAQLAQGKLTDEQRGQLQIQARLLEAQIRKLGVETQTSALQLEKEKLMKKPYELANELISGRKKQKEPNEPFQKKPITNDGSFGDWLRKKFHRFQSRKRGGASGKY